jgi:hypothetical protein
MLAQRSILGLLVIQSAAGFLPQAPRRIGARWAAGHRQVGVRASNDASIQQQVVHACFARTLPVQRHNAPTVVAKRCLAVGQVQTEMMAAMRAKNATTLSTVRSWHPRKLPAAVRLTAVFDNFRCRRQILILTWRPHVRVAAVDLFAAPDDQVGVH